MSLTVAVTIDGVSRSLVNGTMAINLRANDLATLSAQVYSATGSWRPDLNDEIVITVNSVVQFGGYIKTIREAGAGGQPITPILSDITASDYNEIPARKLVAEARPSETLEDRLTWLVNSHLDDYGVTLDAGQITGPTLEAAAYAYESIDSILTGLARLTGPDYIWRIDFTKALKVYSASGVSAPFNVSVGSGHAIGDITVEPTQDGFANRVIVQYGAPGTVEKTDAFTGDGSTTAFTLTYPMVYVPTVGRGYVTYDGNAETLDLTGVAGATWEYAPAANTITRDTAPANTKAISITYDAQFPCWVAADGGAAAADLVMVKLDRPDVYDVDQAQAIADAELAAREVTTKTVRYVTRTAGLVPGMTQTITNASRSLSAAACVITEVTITNDGGPNAMHHAITAIAQGPITTWRDTWRGFSGSASSVGGSALVVASSSPAWNGNVPPPNTAVAMGVGGFASTAAAMTFDGYGAGTNRWGIAVGTDSLGDFLGIANTTLGDWIAKFYELGGSAYLASSSAGSKPLSLGYPGTGTEIYRAYIDTLYMTSRSKVYEGQSATLAMGEWGAVAHGACTFTASSGTWTVASGDLSYLRMMRVGRAITIRGHIITSSVSATPTELRLAISGVTFDTNDAWGTCLYSNDGSTVDIGQAIASASGDYIVFKTRTSAAWATTTDLTAVLFSVTAEMA